jgi:hypothetical protein
VARPLRGTVDLIDDLRAGRHPAHVDHRRVPDEAWRCQTRDTSTGRYSSPFNRACDRCGSDLDHPLDICCWCDHLVVFHGSDTDGCGRIGAAGWCECRCTFDRPNAEFVKWG